MTTAAIRKISVFHISLLTILHAFAMCALGYFALLYYYLADNDISLWSGYGVDIDDIFQTFLSLIDDAALLDERLSARSQILNIYFVFSLLIPCIFAFYRKIDNIKNRYTFGLFYSILGSVVLVYILFSLGLSATEIQLLYYGQIFILGFAFFLLTYTGGKVLVEYSSTGILKMNPLAIYSIYPVLLLSTLFSTINY